MIPMEWLNINVPGVLRSPSYIGSKPVDRATWLSLLGYCVSQENGGVIPGCAGWGDRQWQQLAGVMRAEVKSRCALWRWDKGAIHVLHYPAEQEETVRRLRAQAKAASDERWRREREAKKAAAALAGRNGHKPSAKSSRRNATAPVPRCPQCGGTDSECPACLPDGRGQ